MDIKEFKDKSTKIHMGKYLYDKVDYKNNKTKVVITCQKHGDFLQLPHNHLSGKGCSECGSNKKIDYESFINKSNLKHNFYYNYEIVNFIDSNAKVKIICPIHGIFEQIPIRHISGYGCIICGGCFKSNKEDFSKKSNLIHLNKFDYSLVNYINNKTKVKIICPEHGIFEQIPSNHLKGIGCSKCSGKYNYNTETFIQKSKLIHGNLYSYDKTIYVNCKTPVKILCSKHGIFDQVPMYHLSGHGCSNCRISKGEIIIEDILKFKKVNYKKQFSFNDLKFKNKLKFDFAIFDEFNKLKFLIEYNGEQHYFYRGQFGMKKDTFNNLIIRDNLKSDYCKYNKINIFTIKYNEDINSITLDILSKELGI